MDLGSPIASIIPGVRGVVLAILAQSGRPLTGHGIAELSGGRASQQGISVVLRDLVDSGIVLKQPAGRANLYTLNREHVAADAIVMLADLRDDLTKRLRRYVAGWATAAVAVWMFGSMARGEGATASDIDLVVIRPDSVDEEDPVWAEQNLGLRVNVLEWSGNGCDILEYDESGWAELVESGDSLATSVRLDALVVAGKHPRDLTRVRRR